jgi:hypothetical protein
VHSGAHTGGDLRAEGLEGILESREDRISGASLSRGNIRDGCRSGSRGRGRNRHLSLGGGLATLRRGRGGGSCRGSS